MSDRKKLYNTTSPGEQKRRWRLLSISREESHKTNDDRGEITVIDKPAVACIQAVEIDSEITPYPKIREIHPNFLPITADESWGREGTITSNFEFYPVEYEITIRRVEPTPGFVDFIEDDIQESRAYKDAISIDGTSDREAMRIAYVAQWDEFHAKSRKLEEVT